MHKHLNLSNFFLDRGIKYATGALIVVALAACGGDNDPKSVATVTPGTSSQPTSPGSPPQTSPPAPDSSPPQVNTPSFNWPANHSVVDPNRYAAVQDEQAARSERYTAGPNGGDGDDVNVVSNASLDLKSIDETPSAKHHQMTANGQTIEYTASAGHLIAWAPEDPAAPAKRDAKASIFYMAYTRDDLPKEKRPITFVFNGGPGEPSIWLHLGSWAPKRLKVEAPNVPPGADIPDSYPLIDNDQTLLDKTDLVYIDIVGSGYSEAIAPHKNSDFWNTDADAEVFRDFITAYINRNNRQSSPKYLMGESYSGIRAPILADLLVKSGTQNYAPDPTGKKPIVLSGIVLQSPVLDYGNMSTNGGSDLGLFPTVSMVADYFGKSTVRGTQSDADYASYLRKFTLEKLASASVRIPSSSVPQALAIELNAIGGWPVSYLMTTLRGAHLDFRSIGGLLYPGESDLHINDYDGRMMKTGELNYDLSSYEDAAFYAAIKPLLAEQFDYKNANDAQLYGADAAFVDWTYGHRGQIQSRSVLDLVETLVYAPNVKVLVMHGYHDSITPFFQTELDLAYAGLLDITNPGKDGRLVVREDNGGHMEYLTESSRASMRANLSEFYGS